MSGGLARGLVAVVAAAAPPEYRDALAGDLLEEWRTEVRPARGSWRAWGWLASQAAGSLLPLLERRWRRFELQPALAATIAALAVAMAAIAAGAAAWGWLLAQVPLRAGHAAPWPWRLFGSVGVMGLAWIAARVTARRFRGTGGHRR